MICVGIDVANDCFIVNSKEVALEDVFTVPNHGWI